MKRWIEVSVLLALFSYSLYSEAKEGTFYRYKDKDNNTMISNTLPPDLMNEGYEIVNSTGDVIETVPKQKSQAEFQKMEDEKQKQQTFLEQEKEQQRKNKIILKSYSSQADIERARDDKIASIKILEEIVKENIHGLNVQLKNTREAIANYEQTGSAVPESLKKTLDNTLRQIRENEDFLARKALEKQNIIHKYQEIINKFNTLEKKNTIPPSSVAPSK